MIVSLPASGAALAVGLDAVGNRRFQGSRAPTLPNLPVPTPRGDGAAASRVPLWAHLDYACRIYLR